MAPLVDAIGHKLVSSTASSAVYEGRFDPEWCVGTVPNGGYSLSMCTTCVRDYLVNQLKSPHKDPFHIASSYLNATDRDTEWIVEVTVTKRGKGFSNVDALLRQKSHKTKEMLTRLQVNFIFTNFASFQSDRTTEHLTLRPESPFYSHLPIETEPKDCKKNVFENASKIPFRHRLQVFRDEKARDTLFAQNKLQTIGYPTMEDVPVPEQDIDHFNTAIVSLFADTSEMSLGFLERDKRRDGDYWFPTMFLSLELKRALPTFAMTRAATTTRTRHFDHGQFEMDVEVWSHPYDAERLGLPPGVRSVILCIARQVALSIPIAVQASITARRKESSRL